MKKTNAAELAKKLGVSPSRGMEAVIKAQLIGAPFFWFYNAFGTVSVVKV